MWHGSYYGDPTRPVYLTDDSTSPYYNKTFVKFYDESNSYNAYAEDSEGNIYYLNKRYGDSLSSKINLPQANGATITNKYLVVGDKA